MAEAACAASPREVPFVSVLMPVCNEARFVRPAVSAILAQDYPQNRIEVIVADGASTDGTRDVLADMQQGAPRLVVVDNPGRIVSTGLNAALARARGEIVIRIDGHALVAPDFVRENVALLAEHPEAWSVGGSMRHSATTTFGHAVALAMAHPLGVGNARHRFADYEGYSDSTAFPAFRRWVFDRVGAFDPRLVRNQDDEFSYRITRAGGKVYVSPRVRSSYFVRERIAQLFRQYFQYGFWRIPVVRKHRRPTTLRQVVPTLFYAACVVLAAAGVAMNRPDLAVILPALYGIALAGAGVAAAPRHGVAIALRLPVAIATMHAGYALGVAYGLWAAAFRPAAWDTQGRMARLSR